MHYFFQAALAAICLVFAVTLPGAAQTAEQIQYVRYEVTGADARALRRNLNQKTPVNIGGKRFDAKTDWNVSWRYQFETADGLCRIGATSTQVTSIITMPAWRNESAAPVTDAGRWNQYIESLTIHEEGHHRNALAAAEQIEKALPNLPPQPDCKQAGAAAEAKGHAVMDEIRVIDARYDAETRHGATQGAYFP